MGLRMGLHIGLQQVEPQTVGDLAAGAETAGFDWISVWDHFYADGGLRPDDGLDNLEAIAMHAYVASRTTRAEIGCLVYCAAYRNPALLAKALATIDRISGGRVAAGLGAGWSGPEFESYGVDFHAVGARMDQLEEAAQCLTGMLSAGDGGFSFAGEHFRLDGATCSPGPVRDRLPLWIGGTGEQRLLRVVARHADGWNAPYVAPDAWIAKSKVLERHCEAEGRDPAEIETSVNLALARGQADLDRQFGPLAEIFEPGSLVGSDEQIADRLGQYADAGVAGVNVAVRTPWDLDDLARVASLVPKSQVADTAEAR